MPTCEPAQPEQNACVRTKLQVDRHTDIMWEKLQIDVHMGEARNRWTHGYHMGESFKSIGIRISYGTSSESLGIWEKLEIDGHRDITWRKLQVDTIRISPRCSGLSGYHARGACAFWLLFAFIWMYIYIYMYIHIGASGLGASCHWRANYKSTVSLHKAHGLECLCLSHELLQRTATHCNILQHTALRGVHYGETVDVSSLGLVFLSFFLSSFKFRIGELF